jgi:hypothetical protein
MDLRVRLMRDYQEGESLSALAEIGLERGRGAGGAAICLDERIDIA